MYKKILVPIDGSEHSMNAVKTAGSLANLLGSSLTILHVKPEHEYHWLGSVGVINIDVEKVLSDEGKRLIQPAVKLLNESGISYDTLYMTGDPAQKICEKAKDGNYDLIVMGTRGMETFSEVILGSVSHKVLQHAVCPVMIVK